MSYLVLLVLLALAVFLEFLLIRRGMKSGRRSSQYAQGAAKNASKLHNSSMPPTIDDESSVEQPPEAKALPERRENIITFPDKLSPLQDASKNAFGETPQASPAPASKDERSMADIIKEIRGDAPPPRRENQFSLLRSISPKPGPDTALTPELPPPADVAGNDAEEGAANNADVEYEDTIEDVVEDIVEDVIEEAESLEEIDSIGEQPQDEEDGRPGEEMEEAEEVENTPDEQIKTGLDLVRKGQLDEGIKCIEAAIQQVPERADAHFNLGIVYTLQDENSLAIRSYQQAIAIDSQYGKAFYNLGTLHLKQGNIQEAILNLKQAAGLLPDPMKALWNLYEAYRSDGLFTKALMNLQRLIELESDDASLYNHLAICYVKLGDYGKAITAWKKSISLGASSQLIHYNLGKTYELYGEFSNAKKHYEVFIQMASDSDEWQELVAEVQHRLINLED